MSLNIFFYYYIFCTGSIVFRCPLCDIQSGRKDNILRHIRNLHSDANFDDVIKKISKTVTRRKIPEAAETEHRIESTEEVNVSQTLPNVVTEMAKNSNAVCQYQSVIQFAGRSQTPPPLPTEDSEDCTTEINTAVVSTSNYDDNAEKNLRKSFSNQLRVELVEPNERDQTISNISIYRQLLSPYLRPPPNLDFRNGSLEPEKLRGGYQVQSDRLPMRKENVDIYRSILMSATDQEHQTVIQNSSSVLHQDNVKLTTSKTEPLVIHGQSSEYFSEMHWRKRTSQCFNQMEQ